MDNHECEFCNNVKTTLTNLVNDFACQGTEGFTANWHQISIARGRLLLLLEKEYGATAHDSYYIKNFDDYSFKDQILFEIQSMLISMNHYDMRDSAICAGHVTCRMSIQILEKYFDEDFALTKDNMVA